MSAITLEAAQQRLLAIASACAVVFDICEADEDFGKIHKSIHYPSLRRLRAERDHWEEIVGLYASQGGKEDD